MTQSVPYHSVTSDDRRIEISPERPIRRRQNMRCSSSTKNLRCETGVKDIQICIYAAADPERATI